MFHVNSSKFNHRPTAHPNPPTDRFLSLTLPKNLRRWPRDLLLHWRSVMIGFIGVNSWHVT